MCMFLPVTAGGLSGSCCRRHSASQEVGEMTCRYSATDHTKFNKTGHEKHCPPEAICENCMPVRNGTREVETCWAVKTPILYKLNSWHKLLNGSHGQARADPCELLCNVYIYRVL